MVLYACSVSQNLYYLRSSSLAAERVWDSMYWGTALEENLQESEDCSSRRGESQAQIKFSSGA